MYKFKRINKIIVVITRMMTHLLNILKFRGHSRHYVELRTIAFVSSLTMKTLFLSQLFHEPYLLQSIIQATASLFEGLKNTEYYSCLLVFLGDLTPISTDKTIRWPVQGTTVTSCAINSFRGEQKQQYPPLRHQVAVTAAWCVNLIAHSGKELRRNTAKFLDMMHVVKKLQYFD